MFFIPFLAVPGAGAAGSASSGSGGMLMTIAPFAIIILIFYIFMIRPQNKKQKETEKMLSAIKKGDKVLTIGGIHGVVSSTKEKTVVIKVDDNTKIEFNRSAVSAVVADKPEAAAASAPAKWSLFGKKKEVSHAETVSASESKPSETTDQ
jgi:preprotein translocase subunit YajC